MSYYLEQIWIYPVKSLPGIQLQSSEVTSRGLDADRRFMLVDAAGRFITIREHRHLYKFKVSIVEDFLRIAHSESSSDCTLPLRPVDGEARFVRIWDDEVEAIEPDAKVSAWFSEILDLPYKLVYMPDWSSRLISEKWRTGRDTVSFADGYAFLAVGRNSLDWISEKAGTIMDVRRFRPNFVISGSEAFDEFRWSELVIGEVLFQGLKPCERCLVTTIDPDSLEASKEPLRSLSENKVNEKVVFGQHLSARIGGSVNTGDTVMILSRKESPYDPV